MYGKTMTDELTDATNFEVEHATVDGDAILRGPNDMTDDVELSRWSKKGDRLYINGPAKWEKNSTYLDLQTAELVDLPGKRDVTVEIEDETVTITVDDTHGPGADKTRDIVLSFDTPDDDTEDDDSEDSDDDVDESELVTDGGRDQSAFASDETIKGAIKQHDDPDHEDSLTVEEVRDLLAFGQRTTARWWDSLLDTVEDGHAQVVRETDDLIVFDTGETAMYDEEIIDYYDGEDPTEPVVAVISAVHHDVARSVTEHDWSDTYPLVVQKPADFDAGQQYVEAVMNGLQRRGLSPGQAWAYYGVEIRGKSRSSWGNRKGDHDHKNVSGALEAAKQKLL